MSIGRQNLRRQRRQVRDDSHLPDLGNGTILQDDFQAFRLPGGIEVVSRKDKNGDYTTLRFIFKDKAGVEQELLIPRDEMAAITFALARQDQQSKLLNARFRQYKEVPVRLVIRALTDIKKDQFVVCYRKERVPIDDEYTVA